MNFDVDFNFNQEPRGSGAISVYPEARQQGSSMDESGRRMPDDRPGDSATDP